MPSLLDVLRRLRRREPPAPPITTLVGLTLALHSVVVVLGAAMATRPADRRGGGIGVRDLDDYAVQWLVRDRGLYTGHPPPDITPRVVVAFHPAAYTERRK